MEKKFLEKKRKNSLNSKTKNDHHPLDDKKTETKEGKLNKLKNIFMARTFMEEDKLNNKIKSPFFLFYTDNTKNLRNKKILKNQEM